MPDFPKDCKKSHGKYDLRIYLQWALHRFSLDENQMSMSEAKLLREQKLAEKQAIIVDEMRKELIPVKKMKQDLAIIFTGIRNKLLGWYKSLPPHLAGKDEKEMGQILVKETRALLTDLSMGVGSIIPKKVKK